MKIRRFICLFIALMFILSVAACANGANETEGSTSAQAQADTDPVAEVTTEREKYDKNGYLLDDIPDTLKLNTEIKLLYWSDVENVEFFVDEETGDAVSDAIRTRTLRTEERLGVTFNYVGTPGNFQNNDAFVSTAINAKNNGDEFDLYAAYSMTTASLAHKGLCRDLNKLETINFSQPWWPSKLIDEALIGNKLFFASGDLSTNMLYMMYTFFFNKDLLTQYNLESPYELVDSNGWTLSKMFEMSKVLDSAGSSGTTDKIYAFTTSSDVHLDPFYFGAGLHILERDDQGNPVVSKDVRSALAQDVAEQVQDYLHLDYCTWTDTTNLFAAGQVLFTCNRARYASASLSSVSFDYGVLPAPKYSPDQESFVTILGFPYTLYAVTDSSTQPDAASAVLECLCSEGYRLITPALFELSMKIRYSTDNDASRMFQAIRDNISFDLGRIFTSSLENYPYSTFRAAVKAETSNRSYSTRAKEAESKMKKLSDSL
ncbi:MAG: extracellular solute-binding protein, partial [Clostridia bacterium]|nr:extracellular solute-binding protein [Clostridia bacterium]